MPDCVVYIPPVLAVGIFLITGMDLERRLGIWTAALITVVFILTSGLLILELARASNPEPGMFLTHLGGPVSVLIGYRLGNWLRNRLDNRSSLH